jgi:hypothetical protein
MQKIIAVLFACIFCTKGFGQTPGKITGYLQGQFNLTIYDNTKANNPWGLGAGLVLLLHDPAKWQPIVEFTADTYLADDKVAKLNPGGQIAEDLGNMFNLFAGAAFHPSRTICVTLSAGPSFINGETSFAIKPSVGIYSKNQKWFSRISFINVFNRDKETQSDFGSISFSIARKLF